MNKKKNISELITESANPLSLHIDTFSALEIVDLIQKEDKEVLRAVKKVKHQIAEAIDLITDGLKSGGRLIYVGAGTSGRLGVLDASECPPTYGVSHELVQGIIAGGYPALHRSKEGAEDRTDRAVAAIRQRKVKAQDIVFGITASGTTPFVLAALEEASRRGAKTILLTFNPQTETDFAHAHLLITPVVGPELVTGSTRMKAGTATKLILNTITTATMIRMGKVYGNLMVDLQSMCSKLRNRAERIVKTLTDVDDKTAKRLIRRAGGDTKVAIVMFCKKVTAQKAEKLLKAEGGVLRKVIGDL